MRWRAQMKASIVAHVNAHNNMLPLADDSPKMQNLLKRAAQATQEQEVGVSPKKKRGFGETTLVSNVFKIIQFLYVTHIIGLDFKQLSIMYCSQFAKMIICRNLSHCKTLNAICSRR